MIENTLPNYAMPRSVEVQQFSNELELGTSSFIMPKYSRAAQFTHPSPINYVFQPFTPIDNYIWVQTPVPITSMKFQCLKTRSEMPINAQHRQIFFGNLPRNLLAESTHSHGDQLSQDYVNESFNMSNMQMPLQRSSNQGSDAINISGISEIEVSKSGVRDSSQYHDVHLRIELDLERSRHSATLMSYEELKTAYNELVEMVEKEKSTIDSALCSSCCQQSYSSGNQILNQQQCNGVLYNAAREDSGHHQSESNQSSPDELPLGTKEGFKVSKAFQSLVNGFQKINFEELYFKALCKCEQLNAKNDKDFQNWRLTEEMWLEKEREWINSEKDFNKCINFIIDQKMSIEKDLENLQSQINVMKEKSKVMEEEISRLKLVQVNSKTKLLQRESKQFKNKLNEMEELISETTVFVDEWTKIMEEDILDEKGLNNSGNDFWSCKNLKVGPKSKIEMKKLSKSLRCINFQDCNQQDDDVSSQEGNREPCSSFIDAYGVSFRSSLGESVLENPDQNAQECSVQIEAKNVLELTTIAQKKDDRQEKLSCSSPTDFLFLKGDAEFVSSHTQGFRKVAEEQKSQNAPERAGSAGLQNQEALDYVSEE